MDNDPFSVATYSNLIPNYLYNISYIDLELKDQLHIALFEILMNAVEHGNCNITYNEKTNWLEEHGDILDLVRKKNQDETIRKKRVYFSYSLSPERSKYTIRDEGKGFDWRARIATKTDMLSEHGRGIVMVGFYTENMTYNDLGNEVSFELSHNIDRQNAVPAIFRDQEEMLFRDGEVIFNEGDNSNYMYYIVSGNLNIYRNDVLVSRLNQDDIFLGEMAFLLSNTRSATVRSHGESRLILISKKDFVNSLQSYPHYGIFLSRLLANRLDRMNHYTAKLKAQVRSHKPKRPDYLEYSDDKDQNEPASD